MPELGPLLGRLTTPVADGTAPGLEAVRIALLTDLFERAGLARRAGAGLDRDAWVAVWERAVQGAVAVVLPEAERRIRDAAAVSRLPVGRLPILLPTEEDRRILEARFSAAGLGLEDAGGDSADATRRAAGAMEQSWERLTDMARRELQGWEGRAATVRAWQRPWKPLIAGGIAAGLLALWIGLMLGGYLPVPGPLRPLAEWYWSLPWP